MMALLESDVTHTLQSEAYEDIHGLLELPYPSITICPVQFNDRWNLQRELLNEIDMFDDQGLLRQEELGNFSLVFRNLLTKKWVHGNAIESLDENEQNTAKEVLKITMLSDNEGHYFGR